MKLNVLKYIFLAFVLLFAATLFSQEEEVEEEEIIEEEILNLGDQETQVIGLIELSELMSGDEQKITISNYEIVVKEEDKALMTNKFFFKLFEISPKDALPKQLILFHNCTFNIDKKEYLIFKSWELENLQIVGCDFKGRISLENFQFDNETSIVIENCIFNDQLKISNNLGSISTLKLKNNEFNSELILALELEDLLIDTCRFVIDSNLLNSRAEVKTFYQLQLLEYPAERVELTKNIFNNNGLENLFSINFSSANIGELKMISNHLQTLNLSGAEVGKSLLIDSLFVDDYIGILNFDFPEKNTNIPWYNFGNEKFSIFWIEENIVNTYQAKTNAELANNLMYNDLMSSYNKFNTLYHDRGDITSANESYVEIKDIETRKQAFVQVVNPTFNNLINYKLNVFLRFFSDYATNPGKSLILSLWVILSFTVLYMFSFSRWDGMNYNFYVNQFNKFTRYILTNDHINDVYSRENVEPDADIKDIVEFLANYKDQGKEIPRILKLFGQPLHFVGKFRFDIVPGLIKIFNFQEKAWNDFETNVERFKAGSLIFIISFTFIIYILLVKFINSLILSLNSFVVIGFGALPEEGEWFAMSLSIIEGIIGWFLLTIFTITLLSQVLQSA